MTGTGTQADPYVIYTWGELTTTIVQNDVCIELGADIDCKELGAITPTQIYNMNFTLLDGKGYSVKNLYLLNCGSVFKGVRSSTITNLTFKNIYMDNVYALFNFDSSHPAYYILPTFRNCHFSAELINSSSFIDPFNTYLYSAVFRQCTFHIKCDDSEFTTTRRLADDQRPILLDGCVVELYGTFRSSCLSAQLVDTVVTGDVTMLTAIDDYRYPIIKIQNVGSSRYYTSDFMKSNSIINLSVHNNTDHKLHIYVYGVEYYDINDNAHPCTESLFINTEIIEDIELYQSTQCKTCTTAQITNETFLKSQGFIAEEKWDDRYLRKSALICERNVVDGVSKGAYIDTGIINTSSRKHMIEWEFFESTVQYIYVMGALTDSGGDVHGLEVDHLDVGGKNIVNVNDNFSYNAIGTKFHSFCNGTEWGSWQNECTLVINGFNDYRNGKNAVVSGMDGKVYHVSIWETDRTLLRDFYPVYDTVNNEYGMYDVANNVFYGSSNPDAKFSGGDEMPFKFVNGKLVHSKETEVIKLGAFCNDISLSIVSIPRSVKKIGRFSFRNTALTSVMIASDCEYFPTSFPDECTINFYPD